jgi:hypothetical protein
MKEIMMSRIAKAAAVAAGAGAVVLTGTGLALADSGANGATVDSPGIVAGNNIQAPIHIPANVCNNTINVIGALNPTSGNVCANADGKHHKRNGYGG